jgi:hypothetical protein
MRTDDHPAAGGEASASSLAYRFTAALAAKDAAALRSLFASEVDFRGLTPGRVWEARTPDALIDEVLLGSWFVPGDVIRRIESVQHGQVGTRTRIGYRLRVDSAGRTYAVEQPGKDPAPISDDLSVTSLLTRATTGDIQPGSAKPPSAR